MAGIDGWQVVGSGRCVHDGGVATVRARANPVAAQVGPLRRDMGGVVLQGANRGAVAKIRWRQDHRLRPEGRNNKKYEYGNFSHKISQEDWSNCNSISRGNKNLSAHRYISRVMKLIASFSHQPITRTYRSRTVYLV